MTAPMVLVVEYLPDRWAKVADLGHSWCHEHYHGTKQGAMKCEDMANTGLPPSEIASRGEAERP